MLENDRYILVACLLLGSLIFFLYSFWNIKKGKFSGLYKHKWTIIHKDKDRRAFWGYIYRVLIIAFLLLIAGIIVLVYPI